jgi:Na+/H+ antiporter NhaD/arsenite permease-like protein
MRLLLAAPGLLLASPPARAAAAAGAALDGAALHLAWSVPFAGILLSIALLPLLAPALWHHHYGKIAAAWALAVVLPMAGLLGPDATLHELVHLAVVDYVPFIVLLWALFTVTGGIRVRGTMSGSPAFNTGLLALGTGLASLTGTTGAAMLLIRPLIRANAWRRRRAHIVIFFTFLVANIGGSLTPLGDPPLFLGFLHGVPFFWPTVHLFLPMLVAAGIVLALFWTVDSVLAGREPRPEAPVAAEPVRVEGLVNLPLLLAVLLAVLASGSLELGPAFSLLGIPVPWAGLLRDLALLAVIALSWRLTDPATRAANDFSWAPILEVAKLFAGIFVTMAPVLAILKAGPAGALAPVVALVSDEQGRPYDLMYFWITGALSSFLDNAPTYLVFFNLAGGDARVLTSTLASTLVAISAGAVFMGANTYIGNAPNFMCRAVAEEMGVRMPSFLGYMLWSGAVLLPVFALVGWIFFT